MSLIYTDFITASHRNLAVCKELLSILPNCDNPKKQRILHKVYYLSGYIVEFCYKYAFFHSLRVNKYENLNEFRDNEFRKKWREHSFQKLRNLCDENKIVFSSDIPYLGSNIADRKNKMLINSWDVQIRYSIKLSKSLVGNLCESEITNFVFLMEDILNKTITKFS